MRKVAVIGAGMIRFGELLDKGIKEMLQEVYLNVNKSVDNGIDPSDIQAAWFGEYYETDGMPAGVLADSIGLLDIPITRVENACATGNEAVRNAFFAVSGGFYDVVLVVGAEKMRDSSTGATLWKMPTKTRDIAWDFPVGIPGPGNFALHVRRHMHEFGTTREQMALVAVKNHKNGMKEPHAQFHFEVTVEEVLKAPMVVYPFGLLDCCPQTDGAAALILCSEDKVDRFTKRPVWIAGVGNGLDYVMHAHKNFLPSFPATVKAAKTAYKMAGIEPEDIDVAEIHDCFTGTEIINYEDLGFCDRGQGGKFIERGESTISGRIPCNPSGGLKCKGHPIGATGVAQCCEIYWQLRGDANNQVDGALYGLAHNIGGPTAISCVTILRRSK